MNDNAKKWVEALRSGKYKQTTDELQDGNGHCCLGVACEVYEKETGEKIPRDYKGFIFNMDPGLSYDLKKVKDWLGLETDSGHYFGKHRECLTDDNDNGKTFNQIADIIESEPEGLFAATGEVS